MATLTAVAPTAAGATFTTTAAAGGGDKYLNDGRTVFYVKNGGGGSITVTLTPGQTAGGLALSAITKAVGAGAEVIFGALNPQFVNDGSGYVNVTYTGVTSVTVGVIQVS